jgi:hypothetical protein
MHPTLAYAAARINFINVKHRATRLLILAIFLMAQMLGVSVPAQPATGTAPDCPPVSCACCPPDACHCAVTPVDNVPAEPLPAAPLTPPLEVKFTAVPVAFTLPVILRPLTIHRPSLPVTSEWFSPHSPPPLRLHCSLLI